MFNFTAGLLAMVLSFSLTSAPANVNDWAQQVQDSGIGYQLMSMTREIPTDELSAAKADEMSSMLEDLVIENSTEDKREDNAALSAVSYTGEPGAVYRPMSTDITSEPLIRIKPTNPPKVKGIIGTFTGKGDVTSSEEPEESTELAEETSTPAPATTQTPAPVETSRPAEPVVKEETPVKDSPVATTPAPEAAPATIAAAEAVIVSRPPEPIVAEDNPHQDFPCTIPPETPAPEETPAPVVEQDASVEDAAETIAAPVAEAEAVVADEPAPAQEPSEPVFKYYPDIPLAENLQHVLFDACIRNDISYEVALALIWSESGFNVNSNNGICYGLCALHKYYYPTNLTPEENINAGMDLLGLYKNRYDSDIEKALDAYGNGSFNGTVTKYTKIVMRRAEGFKEFMATH